MGRNGNTSFRAGTRIRRARYSGVTLKEALAVMVA